MLQPQQQPGDSTAPAGEPKMSFSDCESETGDVVVVPATESDAMERLVTTKRSASSASLKDAEEADRGGKRAHSTGGESTASSAGGAGGEGSPSLAPTKPGDDSMRSACDACTTSKVKCEGGHPCSRCKRRGDTCIYSEKRRCTAPRHTPSAVATAAALHSPCARDALTLTDAESDWLRRFIASLNAFLPVVSEGTLTLALAPLRSEELGTAETERRHACRGALWGAVALGALVSKCVPESAHYLERARNELRQCFDAAAPELTHAYLLLTVYYLHRLDNAKLVRYAGLAQQSLSELTSAPMDISATMNMIQVAMYLAGAAQPPVVTVPPPLHGATLPVPAAKQRCLHIIAYTMMSVYTSIRPGTVSSRGVVPVVSDDYLLSLVCEIGRQAGADRMSLVAGGVLQGYLLLRNGRSVEAIAISERVAELVTADPSSLQFPLTWIMTCCVLEGLRRFGRHAVAYRLTSVMAPLVNELPFASLCCAVGAELLAVYSGNGHHVIPGVGDPAEQMRRRAHEQAVQLHHLQQMQFAAVQQLQLQQQLAAQQQAAAAAQHHAAAAAQQQAAADAAAAAAATALPSLSGGGSPALELTGGASSLSAGTPSQQFELTVVGGDSGGGAALAMTSMLSSAHAPQAGGTPAQQPMGPTDHAGPLPPYKFITGYYNAVEGVMGALEDASVMDALLAEMAGGIPDELPLHDIFAARAVCT